MTTQRLIFFLIVCMSLFAMAEMFRISNDFNELQRFQRGFGNRRALEFRLKHHYPKEFLYAIDNQDNFQDDRHLFLNPTESIEQNDGIQQLPSPSSMNYR